MFDHRNRICGLDCKMNHSEPSRIRDVPRGLLCRVSSPVSIEVFIDMIQKHINHLAINIYWVCRANCRIDPSHARSSLYSRGHTVSSEHPGYNLH